MRSADTPDPEGGADRPEADPAERRSRLTPVVGWVRRWGISFASLVSGLLALFVFRRELPHVRWIVGYLLILWLLFAIVTHARQALEARGRRLVVTAADYTIQSLYHGVLLFLIPAYWGSTTLTSVNAVFFAVLVGLALLATFDPWYRKLVHPRPWLGLVFFVVSIFAALNVALPLVGIRPDVGLLLAAWTSTVALAPVVRRALELAWPITLAALALIGVATAGIAYAGRVAVPPAPLALASATLARDVRDNRPVMPLPSTVTSADLAEGVVAYTAVYAPAGLRQPVAHVWRHGGRVVNVVMLSPVRGGRREGFRTYSRKSAFPGKPAGRWTVDVVTPSGQLIGRLRFSVTP
ncbi:MAG: DUF2914 domain-containing protein [Candidatus Rokubacteria bacterium]|nr:DUF2914 domain-containing protein [Candidatus Rokubacteria bacterium]